MHPRLHQPERVRLLGRLQTLSPLGVGLLAAALTGGLLGCEDKVKEPKAAPKSRSQSVKATAEPVKKPPPVPSAAPDAAAEPREFCEDQLEKPGRDMPDEKISVASAPGTKKPPAELVTGKGEWTWLNFWAAWCVPCKKEMPLLQKWERELRKAKNPFRLTFLTLDDDERQLNGFLKSQPPTGVRTTYWLREGEERTKYLEALGVDPDPELPFHVLIDPKGKVRCVIKGAVEEQDFAQVAALVSGI